jgi:uncharacterized protein YjdB
MSLISIHQLSAEKRPSRRMMRGVGVLVAMAMPFSVLLADSAHAAQGTSTTASAPAVASVSASAALSDAPRSICYRAHVQNEGWQDWTCDGDIAGTMGQGLRLEALQLEEQGAGSICAAAHVQDIGWMNTRCAGDSGIVTVGTTGRSLRMEALSLNVGAGEICANAHLQNIGWQGVTCGSAVTVGTTGQSRRIEALSIYL